MSSAYIHNTEAIERVKSSLANFAFQIDEGLTEIGAESRRMLDWLEHDRPRYWKKQIRLAWDGVEQAKQDVYRCLMYPVGDERPSCAEERAALKKAEAHLAYCQHKTERLKGWCRDVRHELFEYEGRIAQLKTCGEIDVVHAMATLGRILQKIDEYNSLGASVGPPTLDLATLLPETDEQESAKSGEDNAESEVPEGPAENQTPE